MKVGFQQKQILAVLVWVLQEETSQMAKELQKIYILKSVAETCCVAYCLDVTTIE